MKRKALLLRIKRENYLKLKLKSEQTGKSMRLLIDELLEKEF